MNILVIGNGFDLAHGLKTTYKDFLEYCIAKNNKRLPMLVNYGTTFIDNIWLRHFIGRSQELGNTWIDLEKEIFNAIQSVNKTIFDLCDGELWCTFPLRFSIQKDILQFNFNNIVNHLKTTQEQYNTGRKKYINLETNDFSCLYFFIENYFGLINFLYDQLRVFTKEFEKYLIDNVCSTLTNESKYLLSFPNSKELIVLSFNYTNICEILYQYDFNVVDYNLPIIKPIYVHGKVEKDGGCNLVLGTHSFDNTNISTDFNVFKKHNQRHKYGTIEAYQELLKKLNAPKVKPMFHVIGHSLDETDHSILKHVFLTNKNAVINIYYHNEEAQERLINNATKIIGEEEVMAKVRMIYQHDEKRGILREKVNSLDTSMEPARTV